MWYRILVAYRQLEKDEHVFHKTPHQYKESPKFVMDLHAGKDKDPSSQLGAGSKTYGPGHYTSKNKFVGEIYDFAYTRKERLPRGTRILNHDNTPREQLVKINNAVRKFFGEDFALSEEKLNKIPASLNNYILATNIPRENMFPLLVYIGYDVIEIDPFMVQHSDIERLENESDDEFKKRVQNMMKDKNYIIINAAILTNRRLFQKARFAKDSMTPEEKKSLFKSMFLSNMDMTSFLVNKDLFKGKLDILDAMRLLEKNVPFEKIKKYLDDESINTEQDLIEKIQNQKDLIDQCSSICDMSLKGKDFGNSLMIFDRVSELLPKIMEIKIDSKSQHKYLDCYHKLKDQFADNVYPKIEEILDKAESLSSGNIAQKRKISSELSGITNKLLTYKHASEVMKSASVFQRLQNIQLYFR